MIKRSKVKEKLTFPHESSFLQVQEARGSILDSIDRGVVLHGVKMQMLCKSIYFFL